jgi:murein DD-endopeptidase MepM/ murein hydrolase activator NlpD
MPMSTLQITTPPIVLRDETIFDLCSPLAGVPLSEITDTIVNPYNPPRTGSDDPHQGIDLAELKGNPRIAVSGLEVQSVTSGQVAAIIDGSFPYGYAVMIETPLEDITEEWKLHPSLPTPDSTQPYISPLTCPEEYDLIPETEERSLYLLYAHMAEPPSYRIGEDVTCGQILGLIGSSGNALNPHLHIETRIGPAKMQFAGMAHYDTRATAYEMGNYCLWRVSGKFHLVDPIIILTGTGE